MLLACEEITEAEDLGLTHSDELALQPGIVLDSLEAGELAAGHLDHAVMHVGVLGGRVVSPDDHVPHGGGRDAAAHRHLQGESRKSNKYS